MGSSRKSGGKPPKRYFKEFLYSNPGVIPGKVLVFEVLVCVVVEEKLVLDCFCGNSKS